MNCICNEGTHTLWETVHNIPIVTCNACGVRRVLHVDKDAYEKLYISGSYHAHGSPDLPHKEAGREPHVTRLDKDMSPALRRLAAMRKYKTSGSLLDVGCANGAFMIAAKGLGFDVHGCDLSSEAADSQIKDKIRTGDLRWAGFSRRSMDAVTFNDSLEHFIDPQTALLAAKGILKRDGLLVVDIPDMGCQEAIEQGAAFKHVKPHEHLWYFTATQLRLFLEKIGFTVIGMEVPVPGKVTAYAMPAATVEEVIVYGPPGIGDIIWTLNKIAPIKEKEYPCRIHYIVCVEGETKLSTRAADFMGLCRLIDKYSFLSVPLPRDAGCPDVSVPVYELIANDYLDPKQAPFKGRYIEDWHPELASDFDIQVEVPDCALAQVRARLGNQKHVAFYISSHIWNAVTMQPTWMPGDWARVFIHLSEKGYRPVILGAEWDMEYTQHVATEIVDLGKDPNKVWLNMVGRTPIALAMAYMKAAELTVGVAAGLPIIAAYMGWPSIIAWTERGVTESKSAFCPEFKDNWMPPALRHSSSYKPITIGQFSYVSLITDIEGILAEREGQCA